MDKKTNKVKQQNKKIEKWLNEFSQIKNKLLTIDPFRKGTITKRWQTCNKPDCKCRQDKSKRHWPYYSWTTKEKTKTVTVTVPKDLVEEAKLYIMNAKLINLKINQLANLSDKIFKEKIKIERKIRKIK